VGFTVPTLSLSRKTDRFTGYKKPVADATSDPFNGEVLTAVAFTWVSVIFNDEFIVPVVVVVVVFLPVVKFLPVGATHPAVSIRLIAINKAKNTIRFMDDSGTVRMM
jgi:hypothetical protein